MSAIRSYALRSFGMSLPNERRIREARTNRPPQRVGGLFHYGHVVGALPSRHCVISKASSIRLTHVMQRLFLC
jgi:hypothetical protein